MGIKTRGTGRTDGEYHSFSHCAIVTESARIGTYYKKIVKLSVRTALRMKLTKRVCAHFCLLHVFCDHVTEDPLNTRKYAFDLRD